MSDNTTKKTTYAQGHHDSILRFHQWRTAQNSAAYLIQHIQPTMHILDIGCGPGSITTSFARLVPQGHVTGLEYAAADAEVFTKARQLAAEQGVTNVTFAPGDICDLHGIPDGTYDIVHCHQVLLYVRDPVQALKEMRRVAKPGGVVAAREWIARATAWYPEVSPEQGMDAIAEWVALHQQVTRSNGGEPNAGQRLVAWALAAGFKRDAIDATTGSWCISTPEERAWIAGTHAERVVSSKFAPYAIEKGFADQARLERVAEGWRTWATKEDGWLGIFSGEVVCHV